MAGNGKDQKKDNEGSTKKKKRAAAKAAKNNNSNPWIPLVGPSGSDGFAELKEDDVVSTMMDMFLRHTIRMTAEIWARQFGALPTLLGKNLLWLQVVLIDEARLIQQKLHIIGAEVKPQEAGVVERSRDLFKEAIPYLLQDTERWIFSRSFMLVGFNGQVNEAVKFPSHDPLDGRTAQDKDNTPTARCTEVFLFVAGDYAIKEGGICSRQAVIELLHELNSSEGICNIHGFSVVCSSSKVRKDKIAEIKDASHLMA